MGNYNGLHLARARSQSRCKIFFILPTYRASHIINVYTIKVMVHPWKSNDVPLNHYYFELSLFIVRRKSEGKGKPHYYYYMANIHDTKKLER